MSPERLQIIAVLTGASGPMKPKEIADAIGKKGNAIRFLLSIMVKAGQIENVGGAYRLPVPLP